MSSLLILIHSLLFFYHSLYSMFGYSCVAVAFPTTSFPSTSFLLLGDCVMTLALSHIGFLNPFLTSCSGCDFIRAVQLIKSAVLQHGHSRCSFTRKPLVVLAS